ncbi:hypothetical protein [Chondromyces crocatus]|uniref:Uncharacterized protein n=1 Tax=Chondromyces crocatus TaxID=52 RepID=A0A0K1E883_CHOCO|nr:hypothetical protein [Chondromyces crocatus]AKT36907.1 uncharacterized protein CMC5_010280 [Chondromyces crocatus]
MRALADRIEGRASELAEDALTEMYQDPFWEARYGERGRRFAREDGQFHVRYLVEALRAGSPDTLCNYARWLQPLLTTRGMCTLHLAENFERLAVAIRRVEQDAEPAVAYLGAATSALTYPPGLARELQEHATAIAARVMAPGASAGSAEVPHADDRAASAAMLLSYLADALALGKPELFMNHLSWAADFLHERGTPRGRLITRLQGISEGLRVLSDDSRRRAEELLETALERLRSPSP